MVHEGLIIAALVVFILATIPGWSARINMVALGLALVTASFLIAR